MALVNVKNLLKESMGLDAASIGISAIERAIRERQRACGVDDPGVYWELLRESEAELQALIEGVVVPETWFFRDREVFAALGSLVQDQWLNGPLGGVLRMLSLPCSTGEEPYSMTMALLDAGMPAYRFRVDAVDISDRALARSRVGIYRKGSFRGADLGFRARYFEATDTGQRICDVVRRQVDFRQGNLFSPTFLPGSDLYDVIFCRNVLIYFDRATQDRAIAVLSRLLAPNGVLFIGSGESGVFLNHPYISAKMPKAFALRKAGPPAPARREAAVRPMRVAPLGADLSAEARSGKAGPAAAPRTPIARAAPRVEQPLTLADGIRLADQGCFTEAAAYCEDSLKRHGPSAETFHLLGLVHDASGNQSEAVTCYRKALYLDPQHLDALMQLALLLETQNKKEEAQLLRARAQRLALERGA